MNNFIQESVHMITTCTTHVHGILKALDISFKSHLHETSTKNAPWTEPTFFRKG